MEKEKKKIISIVSPAYNEERNVPEMVKEVKKALDGLRDRYDFEYIFVNDGSSDNTWEAITKEAKKDRRIKGICLSRNFGHQLALTAGLDNVRGDVVIYCDSDLQHPPEIFPKMIKKWESGSDVVHTLRVNTDGVHFPKKLLSKLFYKLINLISNVKITEGMADFKLIDKKVLESLTSIREHDRFLRGIISWLGYKSSIVEYTANKRLYGQPWYNFRRNVGFAKSGILSFSVKPLKYIGYMGVLLDLFSISALIYGIIRSAIIGDWYLSPIFSLTLFNTFLMGMVLSSLGIIALYISNIYSESLDRPLYVISEKTFEK